MDKTELSDFYDLLLMDYAAGTLLEAEALAVACHLSHSRRASRLVREYEAIGGALMDQCCDPVALSENCLNDVLSRLDDPVIEEKPTRTPFKNVAKFEDINIPDPLLNYVEDVTKPRWRRAFSHVEFFDVPLSCCKTKARLVRVPPGSYIPQHSHKGLEITLVLKGGFTDEIGSYEEGDLVVLDDTIVHTPTTNDEDGCVYLMATSSPLCPKDLLSRALNQFFVRF